MTPTEKQVIETYGGPMVPLKDICKPFFNLSYRTACSKAKRNQLPIPAWRLVDSRKAPLLVRASDLASYIDSKAQSAQKDWNNSNK